jgi:TRAP-type mannitol/chloroaromatic compound transport system permease large subunit
MNRASVRSKVPKKSTKPRTSAWVQGEPNVSDPALGLLMLMLIVIVIMMGFPTAFTLMGLGMMFGFVAFYDPSHSWTDNKVFDLMVERTYGAMNNDVLISIPLFVLMGYVMERGALVDKMFYSIQLAFRRVPASLAVATLIVCTFWGIASGLVGAVVVLMGVIAFNPMLKAGYDVRLASGVITAGGTLGILIPPSVMIIVYAAVAGQSVVKLYASAMFPGFFLSFLYLVYIIVWALINPKIAPRLPEAEQKVPVSDWVLKFQQAYSKNMLVGLFVALFMPGKALAIESDGRRLSYGAIWKNFLTALFPLMLAAVTLWGIWWYVVIHPQADVQPVASVAQMQAAPAASAPATPQASEDKPQATEDKPQELGNAEAESDSAASAQEAESAEQVGTPELLKQGGAAPVEAGPPPAFYIYFWIIVAATALMLLWYYWKLEAESFELLKLLSSSVMPLGILTIVVLAVILFGITTATESAAIGSAGAFLLALQARTFDWDRLKQSVFLTAKTPAMVCWLFIGSALFSGVFAILGGQQLVETWVMGLNMTPIQFMILSQAIIFVLGWPLEWTEIIVIFVPIFLPLLKHFNIDPILWGTLVFVNLQAAFLSPPVAMSAFYLKGVSPKHVTLNQIFAGMMPYMMIVILCMVIMYLWPGMTLWLPNYLYGGG